MAKDQAKLLIQLLKKIPIFNELPPTQVRTLLSLCESRKLEENEILCENGTPSDEMYILLTGQLSVVTAEGLCVATILPVTTVGEMGVVTGAPRSATVETAKPCNILAIKKNRFDQYLNEDQDVASRIYRNVIHILSDKLINDNVRLRDFELEKNRFESTVASLEHQLTIEVKRDELLVDFVDERGIMPRHRFTTSVDEKMEEAVSHILVVDDEPDFRKLLREVLVSFSITEAGNGREALDAIETHCPDLVITDILMPEMDGIALLENLRDRYPDLPVVAVSGYAERDELEDKGFASVFNKPLQMQKFRRLVETTLDGGNGSQ